MKATVVHEERRKRGTGTGVACLVLLGITLAALGHVAAQAKQIEVALDLGTEQRAHHELLDEKRRLTSEVARLKEPARIEGLARDKLKMGLPAPTAIRGLEPRGVAK